MEFLLLSPREHGVRRAFLRYLPEWWAIIPGLLIDRLTLRMRHFGYYFLHVHIRKTLAY
jgi:hypothetical protein